MSASLDALGRAARFGETKFGGPTRLIENPLATTVGTSPVQLLANAPDRIGWLIVNRSGQVLDLGFTPNLSAGGNILLDANGGTVSADLDIDGETVTYPVFAIAPAAGATVYTLEVRRV